MALATSSGVPGRPSGMVAGTLLRSSLATRQAATAEEALEVAKAVNAISVNWFHAEFVGALKRTLALSPDAATDLVIARAGYAAGEKPGSAETVVARDALRQAAARAKDDASARRVATAAADISKNWFAEEIRIAWTQALALSTTVAGDLAVARHAYELAPNPGDASARLAAQALRRAADRVATPEAAMALARDIDGISKNWFRAEFQYAQQRALKLGGL